MGSIVRGKGERHAARRRRMLLVEGLQLRIDPRRLPHGDRHVRDQDIGVAVHVAL